MNTAITKTNDVLRIIHISDQHGEIPSRNGFRNLLDIADLVVLSGDIFPNSTRGVRDVEEGFQKEWLHGRADHPVNRCYHGSLTPLERWCEFFGELPVLSVGGNHDFIALAEELKRFRGENLLTHDLVADGAIELFGLTFTGIAAIPFIAGEWNNETMPRELREITYELFESQNPDVIVSHSPPSGILAGPYGSDTLTNCLSYRDHKVKAVLFGHAHEDGGKTLIEQVNESNPPILFSNAACHVNGLKLNLNTHATT